MCCLFGLLDYGHSLTPKQKKHILSVLATACEARGTDATGIAYGAGCQLQIYKRPLPAHRLHFQISKEAHYIMGHTRMTTQGSEQYNRNNHPFRGRAGGMPFALAHNGVLHNDRVLRRTNKLPPTDIETDSYVAVQFLEQCGELSFSSLKKMAEAMEGTFTFTVMDSADSLYIVKGNNPLCLYHWPALGLYLYASTEDILKQALRKIRYNLGSARTVKIDCGEIVRINCLGHIDRDRFDTAHLFFSTSHIAWPYHYPLGRRSSFYSSYVDDLKSVARSFGYTPEDVDALLTDGFTPEEIEDCFYDMEGYHEYFMDSAR